MVEIGRMRWSLAFALLGLGLFSFSSSFGREVLSRIDTPVDAQMQATWPQSRHDGRRSGEALVPGPLSAPTSVRLMPRAPEHYSNLIVGLSGQLLFSTFWYDRSTAAYDHARLTPFGQVARLAGTRGCTGAPAQAPDGTTYLICPAGLLAFGANGVERWRWPSNGSLSGLRLGADGSIYVIRDRAEIVALTAVGTERWRHTPAEGGVTDLAVADSGVVHYIGTFDTFLRTLAQDGSVLWTFRTRFKVVSPPAVQRDGTVYVYGLPFLYAIEADGRLRWALFRKFNDVFVSMAVTDQTMYLSPLSGGEVLALDPRSGVVVAQGFASFPGKEIVVSSEGFVYLTSSGGLVALPPLLSDYAWTLDVPPPWSGLGDLVLGPNRTLYAATESGLYIFR